MEKQGLILFDGNPVVICNIKRETRVAYVELRSVDEALNLVKIDVMDFNGVRLRIKSWDKEKDDHRRRCLREEEENHCREDYHCRDRYEDDQYRVVRKDVGRRVFLKDKPNNLTPTALLAYLNNVLKRRGLLFAGQELFPILRLEVKLDLGF
jgi:hypothetical protein